jgi:hypothetical protein
MCSPDGSCLIEHHADLRFGWSEPVWSPPPESNRRPHPYHGSAAKRRANSRSRRSRPTVGGEVIGSLSAKLCVLFRHVLDGSGVSHSLPLEITSPGTFRVEFHDVLANDEHAVALYVVRGEREGRTLEDRSVLASHVRIGSS